MAVIQPAKKDSAGKKQKKVDFGTIESEEGTDCFRKMVYKYLPTPSRMLPKVVFGKSNEALFHPLAELFRKYRADMHKKTSSNFDLGFCHELIDYFKACIAKHEDWSKFGFRFTDTAKYNGIERQ